MFCFSLQPVYTSGGDSQIVNNTNSPQVETANTAAS